jgi:hypothetical protein
MPLRTPTGTVIQSTLDLSALLHAGRVQRRERDRSIVAHREVNAVQRLAAQARCVADELAQARAELAKAREEAALWKRIALSSQAAR